MRFHVTGTDQRTGGRMDMVFEAASAEAAFESAKQNGLVVESVVCEARGVVARQPQQQARSVQRPQRHHGPRVLLVPLLIALPLFGPFVPKVPIWAGVGLIGLVLLFAIPLFRRPLRLVLRVYADRPVRGAFKIAFTLIYAAFLIGSGYGGQAVQEQLHLATEQRGAERVEQERLAMLADEQVRGLYSRAQQALYTSDVDLATKLLTDATNVPRARNRAIVTPLLESIEASGDADAVRERLVALSDDEFDAFRTGGAIPPSLDFGFEVLSTRAIALAQDELESAEAIREENSRRAAEEARRQRREAEARAEAERRKREAREAAERERRETARREIQEKLDGYMAVLKLAEVSLVERVSVRKIGDKTWEATLTVSNLWHLRHKQIRLQDTQTLWEAWATIASTNDADLARIKIVDLRGNEVGGSRIWAGSLIWVDD